MSDHPSPAPAKIAVWATIGASFGSLFRNPGALWRVFLICLLPAMLVSASVGGLIGAPSKLLDAETAAGTTGWQRFALIATPGIEGTVQWAILCLGAIIWHRALLLDHPEPLSPAGGATKAIRYFVASLVLSAWWLIPFIFIAVAAYWGADASPAEVATPEGAPADADSTTPEAPDSAPSEDAPSDADSPATPPPDTGIDPDVLAWVYYFAAAAFLVSLLAGILLVGFSVPFALSICLFALFNRLAVALPAIALGHAVAYRAAWRATSGNTWRLFLIFTIALLPSFSLLAALANVEPAGVWQSALYNAVSVLISGTAGLVLVSAISFSYRHFFMFAPRT